MRRFAIAAALATALGLGTAGTAAAQHGRFNSMPTGFGGMNMHSMNMGSIQRFPSVNSSPFASNQHFGGPHRFHSFNTFNGFSPFNGFNTFIGPSFNPRTSSSSPFVIPFSPSMGIHRW